MSDIREIAVGEKVIRFEFNKFAKQANGSVMVSCGDTQVLVTVCASSSVKEGQDYYTGVARKLQRDLLLSNGTFLSNGKVNMKTASFLGWEFSKVQQTLSAKGESNE